MDPRALYDLALKNTALQKCLSLLRGGTSVVVEELWEGPKALLASLALDATSKNIVIITEDSPGAPLFCDLSFLSTSPLLEFPAWETLPSEEVAPTNDTMGERYDVLRTLLSSKEPLFITTTLPSLLQKVVSPQDLSSLLITFTKGEEFPFEQLPELLTQIGYHRAPLCSEKGTFAQRGGILDLFPATSPHPFRLEFSGDEIVSIRTFDNLSQLSIAKVDSVALTPADEIRFLGDGSFHTLFDYLGPNTIVLFDDLFLLEDKAVALQSALKGHKGHFFTVDELLSRISSLQKIYCTSSQLETLSEVTPLDKNVRFEALGAALTAYRWMHPFTFPPLDAYHEEARITFLKEILSSYKQLLFVAGAPSEERLLKKLLEGLPLPSDAQFVSGALTSGFCLDDPSFAVVPTGELFAKNRVRRHKSRSYGQGPQGELPSLALGEAVVHLNNGIGRYLGVEKRPNHLGVMTEYLIVEYAEGSKLYVPFEQSHLVSKYIGATEVPPELHTLGSSRWKSALKKSETAILGYAKEMLELQAERELRGGFAFPPDSELVKQFASEFPYEETPDQRAAIQSVAADMVSPRAMDRLVLGDVGYGKTEVAIRAAFKAIVDGGKQVALLVPTTVLATQHFETLQERMKGFPVTVGLLCRFCTPKEIKATLEKIANGTVDVVVGTHRLVSEDVTFKDLGLIVIDEEQRFGVKTKEHLKTLRKEVDCLTLSATPIPRTLYLSLSGAREMSVINTAPHDRLPIKTVITQASDETIRNALLRELMRSGQIFVIHNRIETIYDMADRIRSLVPQARVVVGHGAMGSHELDVVFHSFKSGKADILVSTSIVENGIDIPNANTMIVDRADRFGLAELYQMRGRVGRWNRQAYCYFLVPNTSTLSDISRKRLSAIASATGYGEGLKIALHDLEIRGAGNLLGTEQSGHIASIGFTLYCRLLKKTVHALKKREKPPSFLQNEAKIEFPFDARIPSTYIEETSLRLEIYQRLGSAESTEEITEMSEELTDRFGPPPPEALWLFAITRLKLFALQNRFSLLKITKTLLHAEQTLSPQKTLTQNIPIPSPTLSTLEEIIISSLKKHFPLPS